MPHIPSTYSTVGNQNFRLYRYASPQTSSKAHTSAIAAAKMGLDYDVIIVGAGISGLNFAYRLQEKLPDLSFCILEGRHEIGGTWSLFKYPGKDLAKESQIRGNLLTIYQVLDPILICSPLAFPGAHGTRSTRLLLAPPFSTISKIRLLTRASKRRSNTITGFKICRGIRNRRRGHLT